MMSTLRCVNSGPRMCSMFASEPVSRLSTQITRCPRASSSSHRCDPRKPAPPVTTQVAMPGTLVLRLGGGLREPHRAALATRLALAALLLGLELLGLLAHGLAPSLGGP